MTQQVTAPHGKSFPALGGACFLIVLIFDFFFYGHPLGWTAGLFTLFLSIVAFWRFERLRQDARSRWMAVPCLVLAIGMINEPSLLLLLIALVIVPSLAILGAYGWSATGSEWIGASARLALYGWARSLREGYRGLLRLAGGRRNVETLESTIAAWLLPLFVAAVFLGVFSVANPVISRVTVGFWEGLVDLLTSPRIFVWLLIGVGAWSWLIPMVERSARRAPVPREDNPRDILRHPPAIVRSLVASNLLFALHSALDVTYLLGGVGLPEGMTYAEYAHRGAYPLVVAVLLAAVFVLVVFRPDSPMSRVRSARLLVFAWLAQTVALTAAAIWRIGLYVNVYGLTRWRFSAIVWMLLVAAGLIWIGLRLSTHRSQVWLVNANLITAALVLSALGLINVDGFIARYNLEHSREFRGFGPKIDVVYLGYLGTDAIPALGWLAEHRKNHEAGRLASERLVAMRKRLDRQLSDWRGWTVRRRRLAARVGSSATGPILR